MTGFNNADRFNLHPTLLGTFAAIKFESKLLKALILSEEDRSRDKNILSQEGSIITSDGGGASFLPSSHRFSRNFIRR